MLWLDKMNPFGAQPGENTAPSATPAPPAPPLPQRCAGVAPLQQEKNAMADTIAALEVQVQQLQHDKTELENQRERLLAELDAGITSGKSAPWYFDDQCHYSTDF
jgi:hypothetical protein